MQEEKTAEWFLEGALGPSKALVIPLDTFPFVIGRHSDSNLSIASREMSRKHAAITCIGKALFIADFGSTNHTFVNRRQIDRPTPIHDGDVLHFGAIEFRLRKHKQEIESQPEDGDMDVTMMRRMVDPDQELPDQFVKCEPEFLELLKWQSVTTLIQPIVRIDDASTFGYEVLGRGRHSGLPEAPYQLFEIAEKLGHAEQLSRIFRHIGVESALALSGDPVIFLNTHPSEMFKPALIASLEELRRIAPTMPLVLEIHESAVTVIGKMKSLLKMLQDLNIQLSYDDFGAGRTRLNELVEVPPDFLKFDISLIHDIHKASAKKQELVESLVDMTNKLGIAALAEGVETREEAEVCKQMGFSHAQGYLYSRPATVDVFAGGP